MDKTMEEETRRLHADPVWHRYCHDAAMAVILDKPHYENGVRVKNPATVQKLEQLLTQISDYISHYYPKLKENWK